MPHRKHHHEKPNWGRFLHNGMLSERHIQMAVALGDSPDTVIEKHKNAPDGKGLLLLEWTEDRYFAKFGTYSPVDESATPAAQCENPAPHSLVPDHDKITDDYFRDNGIDPEDEDFEDFEKVQRLVEKAERETPVSLGEIAEADREQLHRQENFRKAARALSARLTMMNEVKKVVLFGSVAMPLWKEIPRFSRLRHKRIKIYHECGNIDLAVWLTDPDRAPDIRKLVSQTVNELNELGTNFSIAHHVYSVHLVNAATDRYHGMVCHFGQCPKGKPECRVPGCGKNKFVQVLDAFKLKPERLNSNNSQVLFERSGEPEVPV